MSERSVANQCHSASGQCRPSAARECNDRSRGRRAGAARRCTCRVRLPAPRRRRALVRLAAHARDGGGRARHGHHALLRGRARRRTPGPRGPSCVNAGRATPRRCSRNAVPRTSLCSTGLGCLGTSTSAYPDALFRAPPRPVRAPGAGRPGAARARPPVSDVPLRHRPRAGSPGATGSCREEITEEVAAARPERGGVRAARCRASRRPPAGARGGRAPAGGAGYADFPYTARRPRAPRPVAAGELRPWAWTADLAAKAPVIAGYRHAGGRAVPGGGDPAAAGDVLRGSLISRKAARCAVRAIDQGRAVTCSESYCAEGRASPVRRTRLN